MERITRWFVQNKVAANMMMIFIIIAGLVTIPYIKTDTKILTVDAREMTQGFAVRVNS